MTFFSILWILTVLVELFYIDFRSTGHVATNAMAKIGGFASPSLVSGSLSYKNIEIFMITSYLFYVVCVLRVFERRRVYKKRKRNK